MRTLNSVFVFILISVLVFLISSCGGDDVFDGGCNAANTPTVISSTSVVGSTTDSGTEVINDSASFTVSWDLVSSCTYSYRLFLAATATPNNIDVEIDSGTCGFGYSCSYSNDITCSFSATNKTISCGGGSTVDVASLLPDPSPSNRYFILQASNEMMDTATRASAQVRVDY